MKYCDLHKQLNTTEKPQGSGTKLYISLAIITAVLLAFGGFILKGNIRPISIIANATMVNLKETDGRTNILIVGSDRRDYGTLAENPVLTDTILVASIGKFDKDVVLISIPRDLWVELPGGGQEKVNSVYAIETARGNDGMANLDKVIEDILGMPIHYHTMVTFGLFQEIIDILGGVEVEVANSFTDYYYPVEGKENAPMNERYETISFKQGTATMDGETALKFVRSRKGDNDEGTDFARAKRQQAVIASIKKKALNLGTLLNPIKLKGLYDAYSSNVETNMDFGTIENFYLLSQQINFEKIVSIVLDDRSSAIEGGLLYAPADTTLYGGKYVLIPQTGDYSQIHAYIQKYLFGGK
ncbi:hypothetical protein A3K34_04195 [candidate division WWE3 bacterium RIFOXYC1_FULL_40_10]|uniref:Cell envelope-related transcriptional attenuator domain-containing protein n=1 Tax=candidate division WWE3 bacterium RIFOXYA2_FULL_46_9 TaxID=1802636 RepID=A0A1F4W0K7_UNCKA|nr:MAG: hypothetical protein A3K58_04195 [candidate division WWE3 bacterium RIFOXYB1_FULL_40_22]OGC62042.1 MAG: hypothetical protein A3K37_04195 [candidate division WWE3 bacterium RIFOXYA1_FULL_40_11]OGC62959.1 MAG: hypothetical protein A2264_03710 [candidate division WWE3 bacterium RIFOXYA2_FULL_46_9]OGC65014.1 MAG: hypothetical protein A2326_03175 [candidate division WWE3 bacterium RIFOXYB2_FULL_41_6]OGC66425.1 MAG: hypothetical protein A3K34_04195 [candidate division WWE3 bacterium RIFOXYC1_